MMKPELLITYKFERQGRPEERTERLILSDNVTFGSVVEHLHRTADKVFDVCTHETIVKSRDRKDHR